jgi:WD40 repeat protein
MLATVGQDKTVRLWDVATGVPRARSIEQDRHLLSVAFTLDGETLLTCDSAGIVRHWDATGVPGASIK